MTDKILFMHDSVAVNANAWCGSRAWRWWSIRWERFRDGTPNVKIADVGKSVVDKDVTFIASFDDPSDILAQLGVIYALPRYGTRSLKVVLPFFPTATMERVDEEGQIATAMTLARMLSVIPSTKTGPAEIHFCDPHTPDLRFYFGDGVLPKPFTAMLAARRILGTIGLDPVVVFPDEGARKRFAKDFAGCDIVTCGKHREGDRRYVHVIEGMPAGRDCLIVDDLIQTGGTLIECREALMRKGAKSVSVFATHGVFPREAWKRFTPELFRNVFITDSVPSTARAVQYDKLFHVIPIADIISL